MEKIILSLENQQENESGNKTALNDKQKSRNTIINNQLQ